MDSNSAFVWVAGREAEVEAVEEPIYKTAPSRQGGAIHWNTQSTELGKVTGRILFIKEN